MEKLLFWRRPDTIIGKIEKRYYRIIRERLRKPEYPSVPRETVLGLANRTNQGGGELVPVRAGIDLLPERRLEAAKAAKDITLLDQSRGRMHSDPNLIVPRGTFGVIKDIDPDYECPYFVIYWNLPDPKGIKKHPYCHLPTTSFVPGETYEELDFSFVNKKPEEIGDEFAHFVGELLEEKGRK